MVECVANNGSDGELEVPLWECPCRVCIRMEWQCLRDFGDDVPSLTEFRRERVAMFQSIDNQQNKEMK